MAKTLETLPKPFAGKALCKIALSGALLQPLVSVNFTCSQLIVGGEPEPNVEGAVAYDPAPRVLTIDHVRASGGPDADATMEVAGTITFPVMDLQGKETSAGLLNLSANLQNFAPSQLGGWVHNAWLQEFAGNATVVATISATPANPRACASVDIRPRVRGA